MVEQYHETARLNTILDELTPGTPAWFRNCKAGYSPFAWADPRHETTRREIERQERVRKARAKRRAARNG